MIMTDERVSTTSPNTLKDIEHIFMMETLT